MLKFTVLLRNIGEDPFEVEELGGLVLQPDEEIDMLDSAAAHHYRDSGEALKAILEVPDTSLHRGMVEGVLQYRLSPKASS